MVTPDELEQLQNASDESSQEADLILDSELDSILNQLPRLKDLMPKNVDENEFNRLLEVLNQASINNTSKAELKKNIENLGESALSVFKVMVKLLA